MAEDPGAYIIPDPGMVTMLKQYRESGRKTFLVTNSLWEYTDVVMNFLVGNTQGPRNQEWVNLFDVVVVGSRKPAFLEDRSAYMMRVNPADGSLWNVDGVEKPAEQFLAEGKVRAFGGALAGCWCSWVFDAGVHVHDSPIGSDHSFPPSSTPNNTQVFQGGNWKYLLEMLELTSGDNVMYVGDHMYSDILRSKRSLGWRTCLVIPELKEEVDNLQKYKDLDFGCVLDIGVG